MSHAQAVYSFAHPINNEQWNVLMLLLIDYSEMRRTNQYTGAYPMSHAQAVYSFVHPMEIPWI